MVAGNETLGAGTVANHNPRFGACIQRLPWYGSVSRERERPTVGRPGGGEIGSAAIGRHLQSTFAEPQGDVDLPVAHVGNLLPLARRVTAERRERHESRVELRLRHLLAAG